MDFGCFVQVNCTEGRKEGLVHISEIKNERNRLAKSADMVKRGDKVYVKVVGIAKEKLSLSMREVDQETGEDLGKKRRSERDDMKAARPQREVNKDTSE